MGGLLLLRAKIARKAISHGMKGTADHIAKNGSDASSPLNKKEAARSCEPLKC